MSQYLHNITRVIGVYIAEFLKRYNENQKNWKDKDVAIYLLTSIATPGTTTKVSYTIQLSVELNEALLFAKEIIRLFKLNYKYGLTVVNDLVDVVEWFSANVLPDLQTVVDIKHVSSSNYVVHTYAAITIDKMLTMRKDNAMLFSRADIKPYTQELLISLFRLIESGTTPQTLAENDYLMKAVMRVIFTSREDILPYVGDIMSHLIAILGQISKNPSNPRFNYYVFESIGALIRFNCQGNTELRKNFEDTLSGPFQYIMDKDVSEFIPYAFQIFSQLLELHNEPQIPDFYRDLLPQLLNHVVWESAVHTYAAITIDKMLTMRKDNAMLFSRADIKPYTQELLISLFRLIESGTTPQTLAENDYLMKAVMRVIFTSREDILPYVGDIMSHLIAILGQISKNPSNPRFNYYVFESIGALIRFNCQGNTELRKNFEDTLSGPFQYIMDKDVSGIFSSF
ncbi:10953_t:CDS:10 [Entrophospora sp. SA101]|nr:10953_t:CDS:10 [Entrophospora sp. SA101]